MAAATSRVPCSATAAISSPAASGPTNWAVFWRVSWRLVARTRGTSSSRATRGTRASLATIPGPSNSTPRTWVTTISHRGTKPATSAATRASTVTRLRASAMMAVRRPPTRSTITPPNRVPTTEAMPVAKATPPALRALPVRLRTSQGITKATSWLAKVEVDWDEMVSSSRRADHRLVVTARPGAARRSGRPAAGGRPRWGAARHGAGPGGRRPGRPRTGRPGRPRCWRRPGGRPG